jgi:hypothetical protein
VDLPDLHRAGGEAAIVDGEAQRPGKRPEAGVERALAAPLQVYEFAGSIGDYQH